MMQVRMAANAMLQKQNFNVLFDPTHNLFVRIIFFIITKTTCFPNQWFFMKNFVAIHHKRCHVSAVQGSKIFTDLYFTIDHRLFRPMLLHSAKIAHILGLAGKSQKASGSGLGI